MRHLLFLCPLLLACTPTIRIYTETPDKAPLLEAAGDVVGVRTKVVDAPGSGVITVEFRSHEGKFCGRALEKVVSVEGLRDALTNGIIDCEPKAWTCANVTFAAHELAHVVGLLPHVDQEDPTTEDNLMRPAPKDGSKLTKEQRLRVQALALVFNEVCR